MKQSKKSQLTKVYLFGVLILAAAAILFYVAMEYSQVAVFSHDETVSTDYALIRSTASTQIQFSINDLSTRTVKSMKKADAERLWDMRNRANEDLEPEEGAKIGLDYIYLLLDKSFQHVNIKMIYDSYSIEQTEKMEAAQPLRNVHNRWNGSFEKGGVTYSFVIDSVTGNLRNLFCSWEEEDKKPIRIGKSGAYRNRSGLYQKVYDMLKKYPFYVEGELNAQCELFSVAAEYKENESLYAEVYAYNDSLENPFYCSVYFDPNGKMTGIDVLMV